MLNNYNFDYNLKLHPVSCLYLAAPTNYNTGRSDRNDPLTNASNPMFGVAELEDAHHTLEVTRYLCNLLARIYTWY